MEQMQGQFEGLQIQNKELQHSPQITQPKELETLNDMGKVTDMDMVNEEVGVAES